MVSKEAGKCALTNSELDPEAATSLALRVRCPLEAGQQVRKRNKALQVRFKDICEAQNEQRTAAVVGRPGTYAVAYRKYMTVPARRSIPNVTRSTGVQTSPDLRRRYQTFPFERKKGHGGKHAGDGLTGRDGGEAKVKVDMPTRLTTQALLHTTQCVATVEHHPRGNCSDTLPLGCAEQTHDFAMPASTPDYQICNLQSQPEPPSTSPSAPKVTGPIAWNSLTQVECLESPSAHSKRKKGLHLNGLQPGCHARPQCHARTLVPPTGCHQVVPVSQDGDLKAQLQAMETLISSSQETIKVLLGVIQELEKGEAHREGLSYRTGQDTANCDTCRNSACIIYSVELDFKQQEDKLQPLMRKLCPLDDGQLPSLPYTQDVFTSTPKRKSKTESKKHGRWKLWFL